jgi:hypothetical protein
MATDSVDDVFASVAYTFNRIARLLNVPEDEELDTDIPRAKRATAVKALYAKLVLLTHPDKMAFQTL